MKELLLNTLFLFFLFLFFSPTTKFNIGLQGFFSCCSQRAQNMINAYVWMDVVARNV